jgi:translation initiation factor IF-2
MSKTSEQKSRPPIVTILGHVDHGKTTLLDKIRKTNVQGKESGGITQSIGASVVTTKEGKKITFIDTPGHAAFTAMRSHGTHAADIVVLVVAADDGVKPQTKESLEHIRRENMPFLVAFTKTDLPSASVETATNQLEKEGVLFEGRGGSIPYVSVSGKTGKGIDELLEVITLLAEVEDIKASNEADLKAIVIETSKGKAGPTASVVVKNGTLKTGQEIKSDFSSAKVRGLFDFAGKRADEVYPGEPAQILGFSKLPKVGSLISEKGEGKLVKEREVKKEIAKVGDSEVAVILKAGSTGSLEAVVSSLPKEAVVVDSGVSEVTESDVLMAKSTDAIILAFKTKVSSTVNKFAETEGVKIESFEIIYKLIDKVKEIIDMGKEEIVGKAKVVADFPFNDKRVAGCKVLSGTIFKENPLVLKRDDSEIGRTKIVSLKKEKQDIDKAKQGEEFGVIFLPQLDFKIKDVLLSVRKKG